MSVLSGRSHAFASLVSLLCLLLGSPRASAVDLLSENFNNLALNQVVTFDSEVRSRRAWTKTPPSGAGVEGVWTVDDSAMPIQAMGNPLVGVTEFEGWTFVDRDWWISTAGDQDRSQFVSASGVIAVADPDEWDDFGSPDPESTGPYDTTMRISSIPLQGVAPNTAKLFFHSSWRPEDSQKASLTVKYNDPAATQIELFRWTSLEGDPNFKPDAPNEAINVNLLNPSGATNATLEFRMYDAANDWWWAVDNLSMFTGAAPAQDGALRLVVDRTTQQVKIVNNTPATVNLRGYSIQSRFGTLDEAAATYLGETDANWQVLDSDNRSELSEGYIPNQFAFPALSVNPVQGQLNLGPAWRKYHEDISDISFQYLIAGNETPQVGIIEFTGNGGQSYHPLDLNFSGAIELGDYQTFLIGYNTSLLGKTEAQRHVLGDLDNDGKHTVRDFLSFKNQYESALGAGSFSALLASVPEPSTMALGAMGLLAFATARRGNAPRRAAALVLALAALTISSRTANANLPLLVEDFESVTLGASPQEQPTRLNVWNGDGPLGWDDDDTGVPGYPDPANDGVTDWAGWAVVDKTWWVNVAGDQDRSQFARGAGAVLVADPDEWDDAAHPNTSYFNAYITTPTIQIPNPLPPAGKIRLAFDSSFWPEGFDDWVLPGQTAATNNQTGTIAVSYDNGAFTNVVNWNSQEGSANYKPKNTNEAVEVNLNYNGSATTMRLKIGMTLAANDWWWAIDNLRVFVPAEPSILRVNTTTGTVSIVGGDVISTSITGFDITSANGNLGPTGNVGLSFSKPDSIDGSDADSIAGNNINETWQLGASGPNQFSEFFLDGNSSFNSSRTESLGKIFNPSTLEASRDVQFSYTTIFGDVITGIVQYVSTPADADFDNDGDVDGSDFLTWQRGLGGSLPAQGNADGDSDVDGEDLAIWKSGFGQSGPATPTSTAVPEPESLLLMSLMAAAVVAHRRPSRACGKALPTILLAVAAVGLMANEADAQAIPAPFVDRNYRMGDGDPGAANGVTVGITRDDAGALGMNQLIDITAMSKAGGNPKYVTISGRPDNVGGLGIHLNPLTTDRQFIRTAPDEALNFPEKSPSSTEGTLPGGTLDYSFITDRGFQLWTRPSAIDDGHIVMDTNNHGVLVHNTGKFAMRYRNVDYPGVTPIVNNTWYHLMVVRPFGPDNGSILYVNGIAEAAAVGAYQGEDVPNDEIAPINQDNSPLVIGSNTSESPFTLAAASFYSGVVDDLEMFVTGLNNTSDRGEFKFERDNKYAAFFKPAHVADLTGDNAITMADVTIFANHWLDEKVLSWTQGGTPRALAVGDLSSRAIGDFNYDGRVNLSDWAILNTANPAMAAAAMALIQGVPEPSTLSLAGLAAATVFRSSARRRRTGQDERSQVVC